MESLIEIKRERIKLLREVEGLLSLICHPILVVNSQGNVTHTNSFAEKVWGRSQITILNKHLYELVESSALLEHVKQGKPMSDYPLKLLNNLGRYLPYICRLHPLIVDKQVEGAILLFTPQVSEKDTETEQRYIARFSFSDIIGSSPLITELKEQGRKVAKNESTILIRGESGTGKEVLAQAIHKTSNRNNGPFIAINCAAIPDSLLESELFGYDEGAFTGAKKGGKPGRFELARGGSLFLDEIGDMPLYLQAKLLRVLQERRIERVGGTKSIPVDVRIIAATHKDLELMIANRQFREDLYYRLNVIPLYVPALRERKEDLYELIQYFMKKFCDRFGKESKRFASQAFKSLFDYHWPGNIRELENTIEYIVNLEIGDLVTVSSLPSAIRSPLESESISKNSNQPEDPHPALRVKEVEEHLIVEALRRFGKSTEGKRKAAEELGISIATLYRRLRQLKHD